jgi:enterochelin esterase family protein
MFSPRIDRLKTELESGNQAALSEFWREISSHGTPLIEPIEGDERDSLVTFLWRGAEDVRNVVVVDGIAGADFFANQLTRLPGTDLWYKTYQARNDVRTVYTFSINDPLLTEDDPGWAEHDSASFAPDPLNPHVFFDEDSVLELPNAAPEPWIVQKPGIPTGQMVQYALKSEILQNERDVWIYTPSGYDPAKGSYPWMLFTDGSAFAALPLSTILDNLQTAGRIPPVVAIFVSNAPKMRIRELSCNERFVDFLCEELLPWARGRCAISSDPSQAVIGGVSVGGLSAAFAAFRHPEIFGNVLSQSGAFWWLPGFDENKLAPKGEEQNWLIRQYVKSPRLPIRFHLSAGLLEGGLSPRNIRSNMLSINCHLRDVLEAKGYEVVYQEFPGGHDFIGWRGVLPGALQYLLGH